MKTNKFFWYILFIFSTFELRTNQQYYSYQATDSPSLVPTTLYGSEVDICPSSHLCMGKCGLPPIDAYTCGCDALCTYYDDCCYDYPSVCNSSDITPPSVVDFRQMKCIKGDLKFTYGYFAISSCKNTSSVNIETKNNCENPSPNDIISNILVSDTQDHVYTNVFCALCNDVPVNELSAWNVTFHCSNTSQSVEEILNGMACPNFDSLAPSNRKDSRRHCYFDAIYSCNETYTDQTVIDACKVGYNAVVCRESQNTYRNPHCAICNYDSSYTCYVEQPADETNRVGENGESLTSLTIIMDFSNPNSVTVNSVKYDVKEVNCVVGEVFDPFSSKCHQVSCQTGYELQGSKCVTPSSPSPDCNDRAILVSEELFCLCQLAEHSMLIAYHDSKVEDEQTNVANYTDVLVNFFKEYDVTYFKQEYTDTTEFAIETINCTMAHVISSLITDNINRDVKNFNNNKITIQQQCSMKEIEKRLLCEEENIPNLKMLKVNTSARTISTSNVSIDVPEEYILRIVHQIVNESSICSSSSVSTCEVCGQVTLESHAFEDVGNETLLYKATGDKFDKNEYFLSNSSSFVTICSFLNQTGVVTSETQFFNYSDALLIISVIGTVISLVCLLITIILRAIVSELRTLSGQIILNLSVALFFALLLTLVQGNFTKTVKLCRTVAAVLHYLWLVCFCWMNTMAIELFRTFTFFRASSRSKRSQKKAFLIYFLYSWGLPAIFVGVIVAISLCECTSFEVRYGDDTVCWIRDELALFYVFGIPVIAILLPNIILFIATVFGIRESKKSSAIVNKSAQKKLNKEMIIYIRIFTLMGLTWIFGFLGSFTGHMIFWYLFTILNTLQGLFIFLAFNLTYSVYNILRKYRGGDDGTSSSKYKTKETSTSKIKMTDKILT